jgi:tubulin-specific chaperone A
LRQIKIKTGVLKRCKKDYESYSAEAATLRGKVEELQQANEDAQKISHAQDLYAETEQLIPNCKTRIEQAIDDLEGVMAEKEEVEGIKETAEWKAAEPLVEEAKAFLETI